MNSPHARRRQVPLAMSTALEYLKQEEANGRVNVIRRAGEAANAVQDANFWAEVNRIRTNGGWRVEEDRISLGNGVLTAEQQEELDREARELMRVRKELLEKKKQEDEQKKEDEKRVRELLLSEPALSWKMRVSPNDRTKRFDHNNGYGELYNWNPNEAGKSAKEMLNAYAEIQEFRITSIPFIKSAIKKVVDSLWEEPDEKILQREGRAESFAYPHDHAQYALGTVHKKNIDIDWWKSIILNEIGVPLYNEEWNKWLFYCVKLIERSKGKPRLEDSLQKIQELEGRIITLTKSNEVLEEKIASIRTIIQF